MPRVRCQAFCSQVSRGLAAVCDPNSPCAFARCRFFGFGKGFFWKRGSFQESRFLEVLENLEILENPQTVENKGESDHFLEILENLEILEILEIPPVKRPLS